MYSGFITRLKNVRQHSNADRLQIGECFGNNVVVSMDYVENQLGVYFPVDGKLGVEFANANNLLRKKDTMGNNIGGYLDEEKRNITAIKLRGEKSDGLFLPLESLKDFCDISVLKEGEFITTLNGITICEKYIPRKNNGGCSNAKNIKEKSLQKKTISYPYFEEHTDTSQLAYNLNQFKVGDTCYITIKNHGTSARTSYAYFEKEKQQNFLQRLFRIKPKKNTGYEMVSGTRRVVLENYDGGFYGNNSFRQKYHNFFSGKLYEGETVYYEIVGYTDDGGLIMPECNNEKTKDKEFIKKYGKTTKFTYGCEIGQNDMYVYRMTMTTPQGICIEYPWELVKERCGQMGCKTVMECDKFIFTTQEDLMERVEKFYDGEDPVGKSHVREGIVVRIDNKSKFVAYKHKNFSFKVLEGIIKTDAVEPDMEEAQE